MTNESPDARNNLSRYLDELALNPTHRLVPAELLRGGTKAVPDGFDVVIDTYNETLSLFGPYSDQGVRVKTLAPWGGGFKVTALELLRSFIDVCGRGESRNVAELAQELRGRLNDLPPFTVPARPPMNRAEMIAHVESCPSCAQVSPEMAKTIDAGSTAYADKDMADMIARSHANVEEAIHFYQQRCKGLLGVISSAPAKPTRSRRPVAATAEVSS